MKKIPIQIIWITKFIIIDTLSKLISLRFIKIIPTVIGIRKRTNPLKIEVEIINENSDKTSILIRKTCSFFVRMVSRSFPLKYKNKQPKISKMITILTIHMNFSKLRSSNMDTIIDCINKI